MSQSYPLQQYASDLRSIAAVTSDEDEILRRVGPLAQRFVADKSWLLPEHYETDAEQGFGVHTLHEEPDHSLAVIAVSWLPGRGAPPHNHGINRSCLWRGSRSQIGGAETTTDDDRALRLQKAASRERRDETRAGGFGDAGRRLTCAKIHYG